jgi:PKD repeat protein
VQDQAGQRVVLVSGNGQSALVDTTVPEPLVVALLDASGDPVSGRAVEFTVTRSDGLVRAFPDEGTSLTVMADDNGLASVLFVLGDRAGVGNNRVIAKAAGFLGEVEFCASALTAAAEQITAVDGDNQTGTAEQTLPRPFLALVTDAQGNAVGGVDVEFAVLEGGGTFEGVASITRTTNMDGEVSAVLTLGPQDGLNNNVVVASIVGFLDAQTTFTASGRGTGPASDTSVSGVVLDNQDLPMANVTVEIQHTALTAITGDEGQFTIPNAPVGVIDLIVDGTTTTRDGEWPVLHFVLTTIPGQDNTVGMPIYLLPLDTDNSKIVGGSEDVTLRMAGIPGAELTIFANSVTCPDGSSQCRVSWTQVNLERVPMPPPLGSAFMPAWTVQPPGITFNKPARVCIPNMGSPPGEQVEVYSFDHDLFQFVAIGLATVTADGAQVCSDPGFGVVKAGWGGVAPPPPPCNPVANCQDNDNNVCTQKRPERRGRCSIVCVPVNTNGRGCNDEDECTVNDACMGGSCRGKEKKLTTVDAKANGETDIDVTLGDEVNFGVDAAHENCGNVTFEWDFGDGESSNAENPSHTYSKSGEFTATITVKCDDCDERTDVVNVTVATKDVVVIGWVDPDPINLDALAPGANLLLRIDLNTPIACSLLLSDWATGFRTDISSEGDRIYANAFLLKNSPNQRPPATINPDAVESAGDFRLFNRFRVQFGDGGVTDFEILSTSSALAGKTPDPCTGLVLPVLSSPETHNANGANGLSTSGNRVFQLAQGRVGTIGQAADLTLNDCDEFLGFCTNILSDVGKTTPWIWSVIGFDAQGNRGSIDHQIFPTYFVYEDNVLVEQVPQAPDQVFIALDETSQRKPSEIP